MARGKRLQRRIVTGHFTLPIAILLSAVCWLVAILVHSGAGETGKAFTVPPGGGWSNGLLPLPTEQILSYLFYALTGYLLVALNNRFAIIRMRASVQTALYFLLTAACPQIYRLSEADVAALILLPAFYFLFNSYQKPQPQADLFQTFVCLSAGSLLMPQLTLLLPVFWIGAYRFQSLNPRSFLASLIGWGLPYWLLLAYAYCREKMELFYEPFRELVRFRPLAFGLQPWEAAMAGYLLILFTASTVHYFATSHDDKIRTRNYLRFFVTLTLFCFAWMALQPGAGLQLIPILLLPVSILSGHLFALSDSRASNLFFIGALAGLIALFLFNLLQSL